MSSLMKKYGATLFLFLAAVALGGYYFLVFEPAVEERKRIEAFEKTFFHADSDRVLLIHIRTGPQVWNISRQDAGRWTLGDGVPADPAAVGNLFEALAGGAVKKRVGTGKDRRRFGFDNSNVTIQLGYRDRVEAMELAGENPASTGFYAYSRSLDAIFLVNRNFVETIRNTLLDIRDRRVFRDLRADPVSRVSVKRQADTVELVRNDAGWRMLEPFPGPADRGEVQNLLREIRLVKARTFEPWRDDFDRIDKRISLDLWDATGGSLCSFEVVFWGTERFKGMLVHRPGESQAAVVRREFWNLLDSYGFRFADRRLLAFEPAAVTRLRFLKDGAWVELSRSGDEWVAGAKRLADDRVAALLERLNRWKARGLVKGTGLPDAPRFAVEVHSAGGVDQVVVSDVDMQSAVAKTPLFARTGDGLRREKVAFRLTRASRLEPSAVVSLLAVRDVFSLLDEALR